MTLLSRIVENMHNKMEPMDFSKGSFRFRMLTPIPNNMIILLQRMTYKL